MTPKLIEGAERLTRWLESHALPLWRDKGYIEGKGFVEALDRHGEPTSDAVRARVNPRQVYCFAEAGRRGWISDWKEPVQGALDRFDDVYLRNDGFYAHLATLDGDIIDPKVDIYDQAFALLAFAAVAKARSTEAKPMSARAHALLTNLQNNFAHPQTGFLEADGSKTLRSNPHMHLFEAAQAWHGVNGVDAIVFTGLADEIADLCLARFIDGHTGALHEFFDEEWNRAPGSAGDTVEPGHQFEWAWLLARWAQERGNRPELMKAAARLFEVGETKGVDGNRSLAVMGLGQDYKVTDPVARLWSQTEWLKAALLLAQAGPAEKREHYLGSAERALDAFESYLTTDRHGLWHDKKGIDDRFVAEPAPASSLYHIVCATGELVDRTHVRESAGAA